MHDTTDQGGFGPSGPPESPVRASCTPVKLESIQRVSGSRRRVIPSTSRYPHLARDPVQESAAGVAAGIGADTLPGGSAPKADSGMRGDSKTAVPASAPEIAGIFGSWCRQATSGNGLTWQ